MPYDFRNEMRLEQADPSSPDYIEQLQQYEMFDSLKDGSFKYQSSYENDLDAELFEGEIEEQDYDDFQDGRPRILAWSFSSIGNRYSMI